MQRQQRSSTWNSNGQLLSGSSAPPPPPLSQRERFTLCFSIWSPSQLIQLYPIWQYRNISHKTKIRTCNTQSSFTLPVKLERWIIAAHCSSGCLRFTMSVLWHNMPMSSCGKAPAGWKFGVEIQSRKWRWLGQILEKSNVAIEKNQWNWTSKG